MGGGVSSVQLIQHFVQVFCLAIGCPWTMDIATSGPQSAKVYLSYGFAELEVGTGSHLQYLRVKGESALRPPTLAGLLPEIIPFLPFFSSSVLRSNRFLRAPLLILDVKKTAVHDRISTSCNRNSVLITDNISKQRDLPLQVGMTRPL